MDSIISWATSHPGLYTQAVAALVFQLMGVVLVVDDVRTARRRLDSLYARFAEIDTSAKLQIKRADLDVFDRSGNIRPDVDFQTVFAAPFLTIQELIGAVSDKTTALAEHHDKHQGRRWAT